MTWKSITVASLAFVCTFLFAYCLVASKFTVDQLEKAVARDATVGSDAATVRDLLEQNGIDYSDNPKAIEHSSILRSNEFAEIRPSVKRYMGAIIRDTQPAIVGRWGIQLSFFFDGDDKLIGH